MRLYSEFRLWPVGQGLFYSGSIRKEDNSFEFIYDCGGDKLIISNIVDNYLKYSSKEIDMLVISHFDEDHINGLPYLLDKVKKIKKIFIPYYDGISSYLLFLAYIYGNGGNFSDKIDDIIMVRTNHIEEENIPNDFNELRSKRAIDETYMIGNIRVSEMEVSSTIDLKGIWKFKFYNTLLKKNKSVGTIKDRIDNLINQNASFSLEELLSKHLENVKQSLKDIYNVSVPSNLRNSSQNQASLCLYHSPLSCPWPMYVSMISNLMLCESLLHTLTGDTNVGTILTGDISLRVNKRTKKYNHFCNHFATEKDKTFFFLVPHHGASNNWNSDILTDFKNVKFFLNSAGVNNRYGHPAELMIKEILATGSMFLWVNENNPIRYCFTCNG